MDNRYPKNKRLKSRNHITHLFKKGKWLVCGNLRIIFIENNGEDPKVGVSVSKRYFKRAVDRNRIKRLLRESYRLNQTLYYKAFGTHSHAMLFWSSPKLPTHFSEVEQNFISLCNIRVKD